MKTKLIITLMATCVTLVGYSQQQPNNSIVVNGQEINPPPPPVGLSGIGASVATAIGNIDESVNLYDEKEISIKLGAVYVQKTSEAAASLSITKYIKSGFGVGAEVIESDAQGTAAAFGFVEYRRTLGNTAGSVFVGGGYDEQNKTPMGVLGGRLEYRINKRVGTYVSAGWGIEDVKTKRGLVTGGGISYSF